MQTKIRLFFIVLLVAGTGCNKLLDVPAPVNGTPVDDAFQDSASAVSAVAGIYDGMLKHGFFEWSGLSYCTSSSADDVIPLFGSGGFYRDSLSYTDDDLQSMWTQGFASLLTINTCISGLESAKALSNSLRSQLLGESLFCRAFVYFYIVNLWGDATPLLTTPDVDVNQSAPSVPRQQIYAQVVADLKQAQGLLSNPYTTYRERPTPMAANALLARAYLYEGRYNDAIAQSSAVIGSGLFSLVPDLTQVFKKASKEPIWQLAPAYGPTVSIGVGDVPLYQLADVHLNPQLLSAFDSGDLRRKYWTVDKAYGSTTYKTASKYKFAGQYPALPQEYYVVLRLAEQYLIRAEANARLGNITTAIADINVIRARAGLPAFSGSPDAAQCMQEIEHQRQVELFTEWGHRWLDLKRWPGIYDPSLTRADEVLAPIKPAWQKTDIWYPIPQSDLQLDLNLIQNPGYPGQ